MAQEMGSIDFLLDTNVLIKMWRGSTEAIDAVAGYNCAIETVACIEFLQGVNHRQKAKADVFIGQFEFIPLTSEVSHRAIRLIRDFSHSKGLRMADALIAATSLELNLALLTLNKKHFAFIEGIVLV